MYIYSPCVILKNLFTLLYDTGPLTYWIECSIPGRVKDSNNAKMGRISTLWAFKRLISNISHEKTWTCQRKGNLMRETKFFLITAQNNTIRTNHIKARIDKTQQNSKCRLFGDRDETINHIISECSKLSQKENKTRNNWVGKVIHWELCKKLKFDHTNKWYMRNPAAVLENDTHKLLWDFDIQMDHLISARRPALIINQQKKSEFAKLWTLLSRLTKL